MSSTPARKPPAAASARPSAPKRRSRERTWVSLMPAPARRRSAAARSCPRPLGVEALQLAHARARSASKRCSSLMPAPARRRSAAARSCPRPLGVEALQLGLALLGEWDLDAVEVARDLRALEGRARL